MLPFYGTRAQLRHLRDRHRQCARAFANQTLAALHGRHAQVDCNRWKVRLQDAQAFNQVRTRKISIHGNRDLWYPDFSNGNRARLHFLGARDHRTSIRQEASARGRKGRFASVAFKQLHIKGTLECLDRVTDRGLCTVQLPCSPGKTSLVTDGNEGPKLIDRDVIEHTYLKSRCYVSIFSQLSS